MENEDSEFPIAFAVYRREVGFDQQLNSDFAYGNKINNLSVRWRWINVQAKFLKSNDIIKLTANQTGISPNQELIFIDWLRRIIEKFLESNSCYLTILNSSLYLPDSFEELVLRSIESIQEPVAAISLWPVPPLTAQPIEGSSDVYSATEISKLAFIFSRSACLKFLAVATSNPLIRFDEVIKALEISSLTVKENATGRPYLWLDIVASEDLFDLTISHDSNASVLFESNTVVKNRITKVHAFISHWYSTWANVELIEKSCLAANYRTTVLNTTDVPKEGWMNGLSISFFRQFEVACRSFDQSNDYMLFITADVVSTEWIEFFSYSERVLAIDCLGTLSPTLTNEFFHIGKFPNLYFDQELPLSIVQCNDLIVTYIERHAIIELISFFDSFNSAEDTFEPKVGFGLMEILRIIIESLELVNIRDRSFTLLHPEGSSYSREVAMQERENIYEIAKRFMKDTDRIWSTHRELKLPNFDLNDAFSKVQNFR